MEAETIKEVIWSLSAIAAWSGLLISIRNNARTKDFNKTKLYLDLRSRYLTIRQNIPDYIFQNDEDIERNDKAWSAIEQYWYQCFDEWFCTNKLDSVDQDKTDGYLALWDEYFKHAIQSSLKSKSMRRVLSYMIKGHVSFGRLRDEFEDLLNQLWRDLDSSHQTIHDGFDT